MFKRDSLQSRILTVALTVAMTFTSYPTQGLSEEVAAARDLAATMQATMATTGANNGDGSGEAAADTATVATDNTSQQDADAQTQSAPTQATPSASSDEKTSATVKFDANGGTGSMDDVTIEDSADFNLTLPTSTLTRDGYTFAGWSTTADGKDAKASDGTVSMRAVEVPNSTAIDTWKFSWDADDNGTVDPSSESFDLTDCVRDDTLTLYAQWEEKTLSVSFDGNGATSGSMDSMSIGWDHEASLPACGFTRDGYEFTGWSTTPDGSSAVALAGSATLLREVASCDTDGDGTNETFDLTSDFDDNGALTLYAQWQATSTDESATTETDQKTDAENGGETTTEETSSDSKSVPATGVSVPTTSNADNDKADVRDADHGGADELTVTTGLPLPRMLRAVPSAQPDGTDPVTSENTWSADGTTIEDASVSWVTKDTTDDGDAAHLVVAPTRNNAQSVVARIDVSLIGSHDYAAGDIQIVIPGHIFVGRDGNTKGNLVLPLAENPGTRTEFNWSYNAEDDTYTLTNTRSLRSSQEIMIQAGIENLTPSQLVDEQNSSPFSATVYVRTNKGTLISRQSNQITAQFDTNEVISSATVSHSDYAWDKVPASKVPESLREQYPDESNFLVVTWYTYAYHQGNTAYTLGWSSQATDEYNGTVIENGKGTDTTDSWSYDNNTQYRYIKVAYPFSQFQKDTEYTLSNSVTWTMTETDKKNVEGYQPQQVAASSSLTFVWHEPTDQPPSGHFAHRTWGDDNDDAFTMHATINMTPYTWYNRNGRVADLVRGRFGTYTSALNGLTGGRDASVRYEKYMRGYVLPYMLEDGAENTAVENFSRPVTMTLTDGSYGLALQAGDPSYQTLTAGTDYDYSSLIVRIPTTVYKAVAFDASNLPEGNVVYEDGDNVYRGYNDKTHGNTYGVAYVQTTNREDYPDVVIEAQVNGSWQKVRTIHWADVSGDFATVDLSGLGATAWRASVTFSDASKAAAIDTMFVDPVVSLHPTQTLLAVAQEALGGDSIPPTCLLQSSDTFAATDDQGSTVYNDPENGVNYLYGYNTNVKATYTDSGTTAKADDPDYNNNLFKLHFNAELVEQSSVTDKVTWQTALDNGDITAETSGTWYDLLPKGASVDLSSVRLRSGDSIQDVRVIDNYKGSGRQLLVVKASLTPNATTYKDPSGTQFYEDRLTLSFDATYDFAAYVDYGASLHNVYAFESDNDHLGNVADYSGELGDISTTNNLWTSREATFVNEDEKDLMKDLDPSNTNPSFIYAGSSVTLGKLNAMTTGLKLTVDVNHEGRFTTGLNDLQTSTTDERNAYTGSAYTYRIEATTGTKSQADNIVLFDKVDGYTPTEEDQTAHGDAPDSATWRGSFMGVDTSQLESLGVKPVIYYSTKQNLELAGTRTDSGDYVPGSDADLSNSDVWSTTKPSDPSTITYVAIDCSKAADGMDFILDPSSTISARLTLRAPEGDAAAQAIAQNAHAFNQSFAKMENVDHSSGEVYGTTVQPSNYTKVGLKAFDITVTKQWDDDNNRDGLRPDSVTVRLLSNNTEVEGRELSGENNWTTTYENLPFDDASGSRINYSVTEDAVSSYTASVSRPSQTEFTVTNHHTPETISVSGQKTWKGDDENLASRPTSVQVTLLADGTATQTKTVTAGNTGTWAYSFDNLYKYRDGGTPIVYSVSESGADDYVPSYNGYDITNTYHPYGELAVSKTVEGGTSATKNQEFTYTLSLSEGFTDEVPYTVTNSNGDEVSSGTITNGGTFSLEGGQTATFTNLPKGITYEVTEADQPAYTAASTGATGTIRSNKTSKAEFTNTYSTAGYASIQATKRLAGRDLSYAQFRFELRDENGNLVRSATNEADGRVVFGALRYSNADDGVAHTYTMTETDTNRAGYSYDTTSYTVVVTPHDNGDGTMSSDIKYYDASGNPLEGFPTFSNTYEATGSAKLVAYKKLEGRTLADGEFTFDLYELNSDGTSTKLSSATNDANGRIEFDAIPYNQDDLENEDGTHSTKTYTYYAVEEPGTDATVTYTTDPIAWTVAVQDDGNGTLSCTTSVVDASGLLDSDGNVNPDWKAQPTSAAPTFVNTLKDGSISIEKRGNDDEVTQQELANNPDTTFTYDVTVTDADGRPMTDKDVSLNVVDVNSGEPAAHAKAAPASDASDDTQTETTASNSANPASDETPAASKFLSGLLSLFAPTQAYADENNNVTVTYDANGGGTFSNGSTQNAVTYSGERTTITKYSHTPNIDDSGAAFDTYSNDERINDIVTIPGATQLSIDVWYSTESTRYDWLAIYPEGITPTESNYSSASISNGKLGGGSKNTRDQATHVHYTVSGDTAQFYFRSDNTNHYYGYYAIVTGDSPVIVSGSLEVPTSNDQTMGVSSWNTNSAGTSAGFPYGWLPETDTKVYAQWSAPVASGTWGTCPWYITYDGTLVIGAGTGAEQRSSSSPWSRYSSQIHSIKTNGTVVAPKNCYSLFSNLPGVTSIDLSGFDTSQTTNMQHMFAEDLSLATLNVSSFNTSKVTTMYEMFNNCTSLTDVDVSGFDTSNVTTMYRMFRDCLKLKSIDVSHFNTSRVTDMHSMFCMCSSLTHLDVSGFDTSRVTDICWMFGGCSSLTNLDVSNFNTSRVTNMASTFRSCSSLTSLDVSRFDTSHVSMFEYMFFGCSSLTSLDLTNWVINNTGNQTQMFLGCPRLAKISFGRDFRSNGSSDNFSSPQVTESGAKSTGKWGLGSELADESLTAAQLSQRARTNGAVAGTWYAQADIHTVTFDANGGDGSVAPQTGSTFRLPANTFTRNGYTASGWNSQPGGTGTHYDAGENFAPGSDITLYAEWKQNGSPTVEDGHFTVTIKAGQKVIISGLPGGATYRVTEKAKSDWTQVSATGVTGTVVANDETGEQSAAVFTNRYTKGSVSANISATKLLDGKAPANGAYTFELRDTSGNVLQSTSNVGSSVAFDPISYTAPGTYSYLIDEVAGSDPTIKYDQHIERVSVSVTCDQDNWYKLLASVNYDSDGATFSNTTKPGSLVISNTVTGTTRTDAEFTYDVELVGQGGTPVEGTVGGVEFTNGHATVTLRNGEAPVTLTGITPGTSYTVTQQGTPDGYTLTSNGTYTGTIATNQESDAPFTNNYTASGFASLSAKKTLDGGMPADGQFKFELTDAGGNVLQTVTNDGYGNVSFAQIDYATNGTLDGYNGTLGPHTYFVHEVVPEQQSVINYDGSWYEYDVNVTDAGNGTLTTTTKAYEYNPLTQTKGAEVTGGVPTFQNSHKTGVVTLTKQVNNGTDATASKQFDFVVTLSAAGTYAYSTSAGVTGTISNGGTLSLSDGQSVTISGLPVGSTYSFTEQDAKGFTLNEGASSGLSGTVTEGGVSAIAVNDYTASGAASIAATKRVTLNDEEQSVEDGAFSFTLSSVNDDGSSTGIDLAQNDGSGNVSFAPISYSAKDSGKIFTYQIRELNGGDSHYDYDSSFYTAEVKPVDNGDGTMTCSVTYKDASGNALNAAPTFTNVRRTGFVSLTKNVEGGTRATAKQTFDFLVTLSDSGEYGWKSSTGATGTVKSGDTLTLSKDETVTISGVPAGTTYSFVEQDVPAGFTQDGEKTHDLAGNVPADSKAEAVATNRYESSCSVALGATKSVSVGGEQQVPADGQFSFELVDSDDSVLQTVKNDAQGNVAFEPLSYSAADDGASYTYTIREAPGSDDYVYDDATYTAEVKLTDNGDGTMSYDVTYRNADGSALSRGDVPAFVNRLTSEVPLTGKGGTNGLLATGFALLCGFAGVWVWSRRRRDDEEHEPKHMK